ncbi:hypothetical protein [uncultured Phenylobacterium sp.]|uniref:alginate O-acetyltransferase AlgX-related protein n=1 Tax=uncultured Phenylobacterium sp. TaxID=349273 RepID=UPI0025FD9379|nr:hypothetical protein [uncultured Phenylobacterium sp.]
MTRLRAHWGRLIAASVTVLAAAFVAPRLVPAPALTENRALAGLPTPPAGLAGLAEYRRAMDAYVADHFPPRAHLIGALNRLRLSAGVSGSPRVLVGREGWLFPDDGSHLGAARGDPPMSDAQAQGWLAALAGRTEALGADGKAYFILVPPTKAAQVPQRAPWWFALDRNRPAVTLARLAEASKAGTVLYLEGALARPTLWGLKTFSAHDSHWTGPGAYLGYVAFMRTMHAQGLTAEGPRPVEDFSDTRIRELNRPRDLALMLGVASFVDVDYPELSDPFAEEAIQVTYLTARRHWTGARVIDTGQAGKPVLLITVDSFSNAFLPFLYGHFSRIVVAHVAEGPWRPDLIARFDPDVVVTEVMEAGLLSVMSVAPPASPDAMARIRGAVGQRERFAAAPADASRRTAFHYQVGTDGPDRLRGGRDSDAIQAGPGDDLIEGLGGLDELRGGRGDDRVDGGDGDDWVSGDRGDDVLTGGRGGDTFYGFAGCGSDVVTDFFAEEGDRVELEAGTAHTVRQVGADTVVEMTGGRLILKGVTAAALPRGWLRTKRLVLAQPS